MGSLLKTAGEVGLDIATDGAAAPYLAGLNVATDLSQGNPLGAAISGISGAVGAGGAGGNFVGDIPVDTGIGAGLQAGGGAANFVGDIPTDPLLNSGAFGAGQTGLGVSGIESAAPGSISTGVDPAALGALGLSSAAGGAIGGQAGGAGGGATAPGVANTSINPNVPQSASLTGSFDPGVAAPGLPADASTAAGGNSVVDSIMKQLKGNALSLGLIGAGTAASIAAGKPKIPNQAQLQGLGTDAQATANQLIQQYQSGTLNPTQQASLTQLVQNTKNQLKQYYASIGQADSTSAQQAYSQVDQQAQVLTQQMLDQALTNGLQAIGVAQGPLNTVAQYQLGQDAQLAQSFGNFATSVGTLFGRQSGTTAAPSVTGQ